MRSAREIAKGPAPDTETGGTGARGTTRFCAFLLAALVAVHLVFVFHLTDPSPVWPSAMQELQIRLEMPITISQGPVALAFAFLGMLLAIAIWRWASLLGALIFAVVAGWEVYSQALKLWPPILNDQPLSPLEVLPAGLALLALLVGAVSLFAGIAVRLARRRAKAAQGQKAEAMALRIRAQR